MDAESFDLGFDFSPLELAASQFLDVAREVGELQERAERVARSTLSGHRERIQPLVSRVVSDGVQEFNAVERLVRGVVASIPTDRTGLRVGPGAPVVPGGVPPVAQPVPPAPGIPPVVQPGGRAWVVMITETCGPDRFMIATGQVVPYIDGQPLNPPPGSRPGPVFADLTDALAWASNFVAQYPRTPCGEPPAPPPTIPPTPTEPEEPTDRTCPPPTCVPECPPPKNEYCVWFREDPIDCIVLAADQKEPPDAGYRKLACYPTREAAEESAAEYCEALTTLARIKEPVSTPNPPLAFCNAKNWSNADMLASLSRFTAQFGSATLDEADPSETAGSGLTSLFSWVASWFGFGSGKDASAAALGSLGAALTEPTKRIAAGVGCDSAGYADIAVTNMILSILSKWIGNPPPAVTANLQYSEAFLCPWLLPSAGEAQQLFLTGQVDEQTAINLGRLNGRCDDTTRALLRAGQSRLDPTQIVSAYWRRIIDRGRAETELRARGFTDSDAFETLERTSRFVPGPADVVRFLVRDVADLGIVDRFQLDSEFRDKFDGGDEQIRRIAESQGVDRETLLYYWRAHWDIPSPTQLGEFWKRLRPGRPVDAARAARIGLTGVIPSWSPRAQPDLNVSAEDIDTALAQQDILPFWRDKFRAVQFLPLTRVDARRAYDIGVLTVDDVYESLIQNGYREEDALTLTEFATKEKNLGIRNSEPAKLFSQGLQGEDETRAELADLGFAESAIQNFLTREIRQKMRAARSLPEFAEFVAGNSDEPDLRIALEDRYFRPDQVDELVATAKQLGKARFRGTCTEAAKQRYLWGELDDDEARKVLRGFGWSVWAADEIVEGWKCTLAVSDRLPTVRQLLAWLELGVVGEVDFRQRMKRLRFTDADIDRFLAQAIEQRRIKAGRDLERAIRDQEARIAKERAAAERAAGRAAREGEKRLKAVRAARTLAEKLALQIEAAATKWATFTGQPFETASALLRGFVDTLAATNQLSAETSTKVVVRSVEWAIANEEPDLATVVELLAIEVDATADALQSGA